MNISFLPAPESLDTYRVVSVKTIDMSRAVLRASSLSGTALAVALAVALTYRTDYGYATLTLDHLADNLNVSPSAVSRALVHVRRNPEIKNADAEIVGTNPERSEAERQARLAAQLKAREEAPLIVISGRGGQVKNTGSNTVASRYFFSADWLQAAADEMNAAAIARGSSGDVTAARILKNFDSNVFTIDARGRKVFDVDSEKITPEQAEVATEEETLQIETFDEDDVEKTTAVEPEVAPIAMVEPLQEEDIAVPVLARSSDDALPIYQAVVRAKSITAAEETVAYLRNSGALPTVVAAVEPMTAIAGHEAVVQHLATSISSKPTTVGFEAMPAWFVETVNALPAPPQEVIDGFKGARTTHEVYTAWIAAPAEERRAAMTALAKLKAGGFDAVATIAANVKNADIRPEDWGYSKSHGGIAKWLVKFAFESPVTTPAPVNAGAWETLEESQESMIETLYRKEAAENAEDGECRW